MMARVAPGPKGSSLCGSEHPTANIYLSGEKEMITCEHCRTGNLKWIYRDFNGAGSYLVDVVSEQSHICERLNGSQEYPHSLYTNFRNTAKVNFDINDRWITVWERKGIDKVGMARREKANWRKSKGVGDHLNDYRGALE